jgi:hypothetical protein
VRLVTPFGLPPSLRSRRSAIEWCRVTGQEKNFAFAHPPYRQWLTAGGGGVFLAVCAPVGYYEEAVQRKVTDTQQERHRE